MAFSGPIEDRLAIRELYGTYGDASVRESLEDWLDCWTDNAEWHSHIFTRKGKPELREQWEALWVNFDRVAFVGEVGAIEVDGDHATGRAVAREIIALKGGGIYKLAGQYEDRFVKQGGKWRFLRRDYQPLVEEIPAT